MKKISILLVLSLFFTVGFGSQLISSSSSTEPSQMESSDQEASMPMNAAPTPMDKSIIIKSAPKIDQPKQPEQMIDSNSSTWTPAYLKVKKFKKCLAIQDYRGWQGYCLPNKQPEECPDKSWNELGQMNLIPCSNNDK